MPRRLPDYFIAADDVTPKQHVDIQAAAQKWVDSSISKTANVPTNFPYEKFKDIYLYAHEQGLKGCTTFRFNPEAFQGVLVKEQDLKNTIYKFTLEDGTVIEARGDEEIEYDGEMHTAANLHDASRRGTTAASKDLQSGHANPRKSHMTIKIDKRSSSTTSRSRRSGRRTRRRRRARRKPPWPPPRRVRMASWCATRTAAPPRSSACTRRSSGRRC